MSTCPNGHQSASVEWCDVCGLRITGAAGPAGMSPGGQGNPPPGAPGGYGYPQQAPPAFSADAGVAGDFCPQCRIPRQPGASFCPQCRHTFAPQSGGGYMPPPPGAGPLLPPGFQQQPQQPPAAPGFGPGNAQGGPPADVYTPQPVPPQGLRQQPQAPHGQQPPQGMPQPPQPPQPPYGQPPQGMPQPPHGQPPQPSHGQPPHASQAAPPPQAPPQYQQQPMPGAPPSYGQGDDWQRPPGGQAPDDGRFAAQSPQGQQPPAGFEQGAASTGWTAIIATDPEYFHAMMRRSGPEASALNLPAGAPEQRLPLSGQQIVIGRRRNSTGESPDIDLSLPPEDPGVSHQHAVLVSRPDGTWAVMDKDSTNGTTLNLAEEPLPPFVEVPLREGDRVHVGAWTTITVQRG